MVRHLLLLSFLSLTACGAPKSSNLGLACPGCGDSNRPGQTPIQNQPQTCESPNVPVFTGVGTAGASQWLYFYGNGQSEVYTGLCVAGSR